METREEIIELSNMNKDELEELELKISKTINYIINDYDVELSNSDKVTDIIIESLYTMVIESDKEILEDLTIIKSDFNDPDSSKARNNVLFIIGYAHGIDIGDRDVKKDLLQISGKTLRRDYS